VSPREATRHAMECENPGCNREFDPIRTRWRCPHCGFKAACCQGEPLPPAKDGARKTE
jgi:hypothetical protein